MLSKIIVGAVGLLVVGAGGYAYWESLDQSHCGGSTCPNTIGFNGGSSDGAPSCCRGESIDGPETLAMMPREVAAE